VGYSQYLVTVVQKVCGDDGWIAPPPPPPPLQLAPSRPSVWHLSAAMPPAGRLCGSNRSSLCPWAHGLLLWIQRTSGEAFQGQEHTRAALHVAMDWMHIT